MNKFVACAAAALLALPTLALAEGHEESHPMPHGEDMPGATHRSPEAAPAPAAVAPEAEKAPFPSWEFQGWLDQEVTFNQFDDDPADSNGLYGLFEAAIRVSHAINQNFGGHLQINGRWDQGLAATSGTAGAFAIIPREAYAYWQNDDESIRLQFGKWFVPIGFELADPPDLYQFSNSNQFGFFLPTEAVGAIGYFTFSDMIDLAFYVTGGEFADNDFIYSNGFNSLPTVGERLGLTLGDVGIGLSVLVADSMADEDYELLLFDTDMSATFGDLLVAAEFSLSNNGDTDTLDYGIMGMGNYTINDHLSVTGRFDVLAGDSFEGVDLAGVRRDTEIGLTGAALINFADGWDVVLEVREDINDGGVKNVDNLSGAIELIYQFL